MLKRLPIILILLSLGGLAAAESGDTANRGSFFKPDVDNPPEEIYEPLHGIGHQQGISSRVNGSDEIEESRKLRQEAEERRRARMASPEFRKHVREIIEEVPIADGTNPPPAKPPETPPVQRRPDGSLVISE